MIKTLLSLTIVILSVLSLSAQSKGGDSQELDIDDLRQEMQQKMDAFKQEMETAMQDLQIVMQDLEINGLNGKNEIIINGDTLIVAPGDAMPEGFGDMDGLFKQLPSDLGDVDLYFGGKDMDDLMGLMEQFQGDMLEFNLNDLFQMPIPPNDVTPQSPQEDKQETPTKVDKKRKTYSL